MPSLDTHPSFSNVKLLYIGASGSGKTGSLASLAAKYQLFIQDYDNGLDVLLDPKILPPEQRKNVHYVTLTDKLEDDGNGIAIAKDPKAFSRGLQLLSRWKDGTEDFGPISTWGPDRILVIDSITFQGKATMRYVQHINGKTGKRPSQPIWGDAIDRQEGLLQLLYADNIKCHVIITAHIREIDLNEKKADPDDEGYIPDVQAFPSFLGRQLPGNAGRYFNSMIAATVMGTKRVIRTRTLGNLALKISTPSKVPSELPLETGMLELFNKLLTK